MIECLLFDPALAPPLRLQEEPGHAGRLLTVRSRNTSMINWFSSPVARMIGCSDATNGYLVPVVAYRAAQRGAGTKGYSIREKTTRQRLDEKHFVVRKPSRDDYLSSGTFDSHQHRVLRLRRDKRGLIHAPLAECA